MHSSFTFNPNAHRATSNCYQQQSGHPVYNIGAPPTFAPGFMSHQTNLYVNQPLFSRSFASVVSCDNFGIRPNVVNVNNLSANNNNHNNSGILGSFLKHFNKPTMPHYPPPPTNQNKEFEDFTHMPSMPANDHSTFFHHTQQFYQPPPPSHINMKCHTTEQVQPVQSSANTATAAARNFINSFLGGYHQRQQQAQQQAQMRQKSPRWFNKGFRCRGGRGRSNNNPRFHDRDVNFQKHVHEKERSSIERNIHDDYDFVDVMDESDVMEHMKVSPNSPNETAKGSCYNNSPADKPPFMICSLEEFPAIVSVSKTQTAGSNKPTPAKISKTEKCDEGFVVVPSDASISTPSFTPKRLSLCEKFIQSPKKLFPKISPLVLKPCLKPPRRSISESSDDCVLFVRSNDCSDLDDGNVWSDSESETDSDDDDEMDGIAEEDDEEEPSDEESSDDESDIVGAKIGNESPEIQADSGVEDRRVRFNMTPKVHVMRVWDYAYRSYRKGDYWQQMARDHERFRKRISEHEKVLSPILTAAHRQQIFSERFE